MRSASSWFLALWVIATPVSGERLRLDLDVMLGAPINATSPIKIYQRDEPTVRFDAAFRSHPFEVPVYWAVRVNVVRGEGRWSVELMHDKLFVENLPRDVQSFQISHGFNFVTAQRAWPVRSLEIRAGLGVVVAHPEIEVRDERNSGEDGLLGAGYFVTGPAVTAAVAKRFRTSLPLAVLVEARVSLTRATVPVVRGEARFNHAAFHLMFGLSGG